MGSPNPQGIASEGNDNQIIGNVVRNNSSGTRIQVGYGGALRTKIYNNVIYTSLSGASVFALDRTGTLRTA
jgi:hypothetical protein